MTIRVLLTVLAFMLFALPAQAQQSYSAALEAITQANRIKPLQNPDYDDVEAMTKRKVVDRKNKVVGEVTDVVIGKSGRIEQLQVDFNRLRLGAPVYLDYSEMRIEPTNNGFKLGFTDEQIETLFPTMLSNIETAAGEDADIQSARNIVGKEIHSKDGRRIGRVDNVLFGNRNGRAELLYVALKLGLLRGAHVAIPYKMGRVENGELVVSDAQADAMLNYAENE